MPRQTNIQIRRGASNDWTSVNPTLATGEIAMETDTRKIKVGDGTTAWNSLRYVCLDGGDLDGGGGGGGSPSPTATPVPPTPTPTADACPDPSMRILLADGSMIPAGELKAGMLLKTRHEETMEEGLYQVSHVSILESEKVSLRIGEVNFTCSKSHKFWDGQDWVEAERLKAGDNVDGKVVSSKEDVGVGPVVKITVDSAHTYVCEGLLSHNKGEINPTPTPVACVWEFVEIGPGMGFWTKQSGPECCTAPEGLGYPYEQRTNSC